MRFSDISGLRAACENLPAVDAAMVQAARNRQASLTKPAGSLGRLEDIVCWLAGWQRRAIPRLDAVHILLFAGNHGVVEHGVSAYPGTVTKQMVQNFASGGAAINQLSLAFDASLTVVPIQLDRPTGDITVTAAMREQEFLEAVSIGYEAMPPSADLVCLGEMGIGNTTAASAICAALFGGGSMRWVGRGTGVDDQGLLRKRAAIEQALVTHHGIRNDPLLVAAALGGRELAALFGAFVAARHRNIPVLIDGFVCTAAIAPLARIVSDAFAHGIAAHLSAESAHHALLDELELNPLLALEMRLGEGSGAAVAVGILRAAVACHAGMATFHEAQVSERG